MALETSFATAERANSDEVRQEHQILMALPLVRDFLDAVPSMTMVLNDHRQIVYGNRAFAEFLGYHPPAELGNPGAANGTAQFVDAILGRRPGEAVGCIRANLTPGGCGTTPFCRTCGAAIAILKSQTLHRPNVQECRMYCGQTAARSAALDLRVWARPIDLHGKPLTVCSMVDISDEKRRQALERIFFHDVINTAGCIKGLSDLLTQANLSESEIKEMSGLVAESAGQLLEEINAQRALSAAESGDLQPVVRKIESLELLRQIIHQFQSHSVARGKHLVVAPDAESFVFFSDPVLQRRVLINLVKNALEATAPNATVTLGAKLDNDSVCLTVHNPAVIPSLVQLQIFSRSFSTKGTGRGLGTYSIKLLGEKYLGGQVAFVSNRNEGTRFTVQYPRVLPPYEQE